ncbi:poly(ADP-ribose) glycohydrolase isoform X2 [Silurus meridionalis]|uniref:poly(ADP-ribose) glycohydrolase n=1 Tax=Silurus meridionalis TaxID=175797 RepID=A0A8T0B4Y5_SILME|nr:poly(ADP-ribose) glycohydrolase isoform X2 [Silurus meridionalis]KAF7701035.1 hypothetical protein HF521_002200 [Silurus meridionalis]
MQQRNFRHLLLGHESLLQMDKINDSSQVRDCLTHTDVAKENKADSNQQIQHTDAAEESKADCSQENMGGLNTKRRHSQSYKTEADDQKQKTGAEAQSSDPWGEGKLKKEPECHMQLDKLFPNQNHTVLIDTNEFMAGRIVPHKGQHVWNSHFVKLPHNYPLQNGIESRWAVTEKALKERKLTRGASAKDVEMAIKTYNHKHKTDWRFNTLYRFYESGSRSYFSSVISKIAQLALTLPSLVQTKIPMLRQNQSHAITMSQEQIACLLANAFFCTFPHRNTTQPGSEYSNFPTINFSSLLSNASPRTLQKLKAIFYYFNTVTEEATKPKGLVTFERICLSQSEFPNWSKQKENMTNLHVYLNGFIEKEGQGMLQVDFASNMIGGGVLNQGLVQEEIRFIQCPELIVARLFTEKLGDNECLKITGAQVYSNTTGYSDSFQCNSPHTDSTQRDEWKRRYCQIVAIDAIKFDDPRQQYSEKNIKRELLKAYVGFKGDPQIPTDYTPAIATGNWGCGAFKGDPMLKALIQMMAAAVAHRDLAYFTFGNKKQAEDLKRTYKLLKSHKVTVGKLYNLLLDYCKHHHHHHHHVKSVSDYISEKMGVHPSQL